MLQNRLRNWSESERIHDLNFRECQMKIDGAQKAKKGMENGIFY